MRIRLSRDGTDEIGNGIGYIEVGHGGVGTCTANRFAKMSVR